MTAKRAALFTDGRYTTQAREDTRGAKVSIAKRSALKECCALLEEWATKAWFDPQHTTVADLALMRSGVSAKKSRGFFVALEKLVVSALRMVKDESEVALMSRAAATVTASAMGRCKNSLGPCALLAGPSTPVATRGVPA